MGEFLQTALSICWVAPGLANLCFWVAAVIFFLAPHPLASSMSPSPPPMDCNPEKLYNTVMPWVSWMACFMPAIMYMMYYVCMTAATAEAKGDIVEDATYRIVCEKLKEAIKAVEIALAECDSDAQPPSTAKLNAYVRAIGRRNMATNKAARAKPRQGLARLPKGKQIRVRAAFVLAIIHSFAATVCASVVLYIFLQRQQDGCVNGPAEICPFALVGLICVAVHVDAFKVAILKD